MTISTHHHLSFYLLDFFTSLGIPVVKTYTSNQIGVASLTLPSKNSMDGSKNGFLLGSGDMELRLVDSEGKIVEQSEDCDATGKVCLKGPSIFQGYLEGGNRNPTGALDKDGYFHTGETGQLLQDGKFRILGRHERVSLQ
ncbi:hypothetical protein BSKO_09062 [Bryopsis sp. KO-2023]|nr:hypothetical protein BSKO_09062 [Bryopsis sp. KO-2023]